MTLSLMSRTAILVFFSVGMLTAVACGDDTTSPTNTTSSSSSSSSTSSTSSGAGGSGEGGAGSGGAGGAVPAAPAFVSKFDPMKGELPEGLILSADGKSAYVGLAGAGKVVKVSLPDGAVTDYGSVPPPPAQKGFALGLVFDAAGNLYMGVASFDPAYQAGIYQIPKGGGAGVLFASDPGMTFPNGLIFDSKGNLLVADSTGTIFQVAPNKTVTKWLVDPMITGDIASTCASGLNLGANGIAIIGGAAYIANTDRASIVKVAINADGSAGAVSAFVASDCATLGGIDGLYAGASGKLYAALNGQNTIVAIGADAKVSVVSKDSIFQSPASVVSDAAEANLYVTNFALTEAQKPGGMPMPGLVTLPLTK